MNGKQPILSFLKTSGIFFLGNVLSKLIAFLLLPLYTAMIPVGDMGYYDVSITYLNLIISFLFFEIWSAVLRFMYDSSQRDEKFATVKAGLVVFGGSAVVYLLGATLVNAVADIQCFWLIVLCGLMQCIMSLYTFSVRGLEKNIDFAVSGILCVLCTALVNIVCIVHFRMGFSALYLGTILGYLVQTIYLELRTGLLRSAMRQRLDWECSASMFRYAMPLCINAISYWLLTGFNRLVLNWTLGNEANGLFAIGNRFGMLINLATTCFTYAWQDVSFSKANDSGERSEFYSKACNLYSRFLMCGLLLLMPVCYWAFCLMVDANYAAAQNTIPMFLIVGGISAISSFIGNVFYAIKDTRTIFISTIVSAGISAALVYPFISLMGMNGANVAACIGFLANIVIRNIILKKKIGFHYEWLTMIMLLLYIVFVAIWFSALTIASSFLMFLVNGGVCVWVFRKELTIILDKLIKGLRKP